MVKGEIKSSSVNFNYLSKFTQCINCSKKILIIYSYFGNFRGKQGVFVVRRSFAATRIFIKDDDRLPATEFFRGSTLLKNCSKCFSNCDHFFLFRISVRWNAIGLVLYEKARMKRVEGLQPDKVALDYLYPADCLPYVCYNKYLVCE